jgi:hypothetical protein
MWDYVTLWGLVMASTVAAVAASMAAVAVPLRI